MTETGRKWIRELIWENKIREIVDERPKRWVARVLTGDSEPPIVTTRTEFVEISECARLAREQASADRTTLGDLEAKLEVMRNKAQGVAYQREVVNCVFGRGRYRRS